jgi:hypothetical protein
MILRDDLSMKAKMDRLIREIGAKKVEELFHSRAESIVNEVAWEIIPGVELYYAEDIRCGCACVVIMGREETQVSKYANLIKRYLRPLEQEELLASLSDESDENHRARLLIRTGFGAPHEFDERFFSLIQNAMFDDSIWMRTAAVQAAQYSLWPQYRGCLRRMASEEPDPLLREEARHLAETPPRQFGEGQGGGEQ